MARRRKRADASETETGRAKYKLTVAKTDRCSRCPLYKDSGVKKRCTTEYRKKRPDVMFIGEAPGATENDVGRPMVGVTGKILRRVIRQFDDGSERNVAYSNLVQCRPTGNRDPRPLEVKQCSENVRRDIARLKPKQIVICGLPALKALALDPRNDLRPFPETRSEYKKGGKPSQMGMGEARGLDFVVEDSEGNHYPAIATWHFAYVARDSRQFSVFKDDISRAFHRARGAFKKDHTPRGKKAIILNTIPKVRRYLKKLKNLSKKDIVAMDYETRGVERVNPHVITIGFAHGPDRGYVIPWRHSESPWTGKDFKKLKKMMRRFFSDPDNGFGALVAHNLKFECAVTKEEFGVYLNAYTIEDTALLAYSLNECRGGKKKNAPGYGLKKLVEEWMGFYHYRDPDIAPSVQFIKTGRSDQIPLRQLSEYNAMDCYATYRLYKYCYAVARQEKYAKDLRKLNRYLLGPVSAFLAQMERNGFKLDKTHLRSLLVDSSPVMERLRYLEKKLTKTKEVQEANKRLRKTDKRTGGMKALFNKKTANWVFSLRKPDHRIMLFCEVMELEAPNRTKTGKPSINVDFYDKYKEENDVVALAAEWSTLDKLRSTFIEGAYNILQSDVDMRDGRVRSTYWLSSTDTGRIASSDPNMQQIPSRDKHKHTKEIKRMYHADPGNIIVCADYSQAEVRWLAVAAEDDVLGSAFKAVMKIKRDYAENPTDEAMLRMEVDGDFHKQTASKVFKKPPQKISKDERGRSKAVVFGIVYGQTKYGLAHSIKSTVAEAEKFQEQFLNQFPDVKTYLFSQEHEGFTLGGVYSPIGRRRRVTARLLFGDDAEDVEKIRDKATRNYVQHEHNVCRNAPIQGVASDTNLLACVKIQDYIEKHGKNWRIVNIVHDSIIAEIPFEEVEEYVAVCKRIMEDRDLFKDFGYHLSVPFEADFSVGINWGEQYEVQAFDEWHVVCKKCGKKRKEKGARPTNRRCEECGSKKTRFILAAGSLSKILKKVNRQHKLAA